MLSAFLMFFTISMLDTGILPFERGFIFLYYIVLTPLFVKKQRNQVSSRLIKEDLADHSYKVFFFSFFFCSLGGKK